MSLSNEVNVLDISDAPGISEALAIGSSSHRYGLELTNKPTKTFTLETHGALQLTLDNGAVLVIGTSEWCSVTYYAAPLGQ